MAHSRTSFVSSLFFCRSAALPHAQLLFLLQDPTECSAPLRRRLYHTLLTDFEAHSPSEVGQVADAHSPLASGHCTHTEGIQEASLKDASCYPYSVAFCYFLEVLGTTTELIPGPSQDLKPDHSRVIPKDRMESHLLCLLQACLAIEDLSGIYISLHRASHLLARLLCGQVLDSGLAPPAGTVKGLLRLEKV